MKTQKNYRLDHQTLKQINWLANRLGVNSTQVIEQAVEKLYDDEFGQLRLKAAERSDGLYDLTVDGHIVATVNDEVLQKTGKYRGLLLDGGASADVIGAVFLAAGLAEGAYLKMHAEEMRAVYGDAEF